MKISELVKILEEIQETYGDLPVWVNESIWDDEIQPQDVYYYKDADGEEFVYV